MGNNNLKNSAEKLEITDIEALKKWSKIPSATQKMIIENVFCSKCGVTTIIDFNIQNNRLGLILKGSCKKCGAPVARVVEDQ